MSGSDKKGQAFNSDKGVSGGGATFVIQDPDVSHFVMDATTGLISKQTLESGDLQVTIQTWGGAEPPDGETETFSLQYTQAGSDVWQLFQEHTHTGGDPWDPLVFTIPSTFLLDDQNEGPFDLRYMHENFEGIPDYSNRVPILIDKIPPNAANPPKKMDFGTLTPPITDATFGTNDYLEATIPGWTGEQVDVSVAFGWLKGELPEDPSTINLIGPQPIAAGGGKVQIPKQHFIDAGDGLCCGGYVLIDKAGNLSRLSEYELMSVALDPLPDVSTDTPTVTDLTGGELLRSDIKGDSVEVTVPYVTNGKETDGILVKWGTQEMSQPTPVAGNPQSGIKIAVPWTTLWQEYGSSTTGVKDVPVSYTVLRGVERFSSDVSTIQCNFSAPGPENPNPDPENPGLLKPTVVGDSGTDNALIDTDENKPVKVKITLVDPVVNGDTYQVLWNGALIGAPRPVDTAAEQAGDTIEIELNDWDEIRSQGPSSQMPVAYQLSNANHPEPQVSKEKALVDISFLKFHLPPAEARHLNANGRLTCLSLRWDQGHNEYGVEFLIPPSDQLKAGDTVNVTWSAFQNVSSPVEQPGAKKEYAFTNISQEQADNGIVWLIEPYAIHVLPTWDKNTPIGVGVVTYTIDGKPVDTPATTTEVSLSKGEGSCDIPST